MSISEIHKQMDQLFYQYNLGVLIMEPEIVTGGLLHTMYKVTTKQKVYAVKWLNPSIMEREGVLTNMMNSELISTEVSKHLPVISALEVGNQHVLQVEDNYYMAFDWVEGMSIFPPYITIDNCYTIGVLLGKLHRLNITIPSISKEIDEMPIIDWKYYLNLAEQEKVEWLDIYSKAIPDISSWNYMANHSIHALSENQVISHRDLDPKNVLWHNHKPYIIDWEAAGYVNPNQELLEVLNYWAIDESGQLCQDKFNSLLHGYLQNMTIQNVHWDSVINSGYCGMLGWIEYNLKRALGIEGKGEVERTLGEEQIRSTIDSLYHYDHQVPILIKWLEEAK